MSKRQERLQFYLDSDELASIDEFRFRVRIPSRAAAVRELLKRGLASVEIERQTGPRMSGIRKAGNRRP
jgi:ribosomal protein S11